MSVPNNSTVFEFVSIAISDRICILVFNTPCCYFSFSGLSVMFS